MPKTIFAQVVTSQDIQASNDSNFRELYTRKGADTCIKCHDEDYGYPIFPIFYSKHGNINDARTPMGQLQCESCHGPGRAHASEPKVGYERAKIIAFGKSTSSTHKDQNNRCLQCHSDSNRNFWSSGTHARNGILCVDCHTLHTRKDSMMNNKKQPEKCYSCHKKQQSEFSRNSVHPVRQGAMTCTKCHNPHGTASTNLLKTSSKNNLCFNCHAEKRGPYLWSHAPAQEDCTICHEHHGSIYGALLKKKPPLLCQQCHSMAAHPSFSYDKSDLNSSINGAFVGAKGCLNCHFQIHGSNHPSGVKLMR